ncbi:hypothetical protein [Streptomyces sp. NPDC127190]|uniref:hypothetical protein n=1 Tax=unclassified Streptomyces TaxID=2593676 RepID=UPI0036381618
MRKIIATVALTAAALAIAAPADADTGDVLGNAVNAANNWKLLRRSGLPPRGGRRACPR